MIYGATAYNEVAEKLFLNKKAIEKPLILGAILFFV
jgi:hypothetical protein